MSSWNPPAFLAKRLRGERQSVITAFYTDVPTDVTAAEDFVSDLDFIDAYSKQKWSSAPQRILVHSKEVIDELQGITNVPDAQKTGVLAMVPPFKYLIHGRTAIKSKLDELKEAASDRDQSPSAAEDGPTDEDRRIHRLQCIHDFIQTGLANYIGMELRVQKGDMDEVLFEEAYDLFKPGDLVTGIDCGDSQLCRVTSVTGGRMLLSSRAEGSANSQNRRETQTRAGTWTELRVSCVAMAWDGENIGARHSYYTIPYFTGTRPVTDLDVFPIQFHKDGSELRKRLCARGLKYVQCSGHKRCTGTTVSPHVSMLAFTERRPSKTRVSDSGGNSVDDEDEKSRPFEMVRGDIYIDYKAIYTGFFNALPLLGSMPTGIVSDDAEAIDTLRNGRTWNCSDRHIDGLRSSRFLGRNRHLIGFSKPKDNLADDEARLQLLPRQVPVFVFSTRKWGEPRQSTCVFRV